MKRFIRYNQQCRRTAPHPRKPFKIFLVLFIYTFFFLQAHAQLPSVPRSLTLAQFDKLLDTESPAEFDLDSGASRAERFWSDSLRYEWSRSIEAEENDEESYPFLLCNANRRLSGIQRRNEIQTAIDNLGGSSDIRLVPTFNEEIYSCFLAKMLASLARNIPGALNSEMYVTPVTYAMKMIAGTVSTFQSEGDDRVVDVALCPGELEDLSDVESMSEEELNEVVISSIRDRDIFTGDSELSENFFWSKLEDDDEPIRSKTWGDIFATGIDSGEGVCDQTFDLLIFDFYRSGSDEGDLSVMSIQFDQIQSIDLANQCVLALVAGLTLLPTVCAIQPRPDYRLFNAQASWIIQSRLDEELQETPWFDLEISGQNQVVAVSDTGIDLDNCYFWDDSETGRNFVKRQDNIDLAQRKVVQYDPFVDGFDYNYGHGTHVAGTIVGHRAIDGLEESTGEADGIARDAKVAFIDIGNDAGGLSLPTPDRLFGTGGESAKIHSASWGSTYNGYGGNARNMDSHMYENDAFLFVVAAGNTGTGNKAGTVGDPATAKNVISVGASNSDGNDLKTGQLGPTYIAGFSSRGPTADGRTKPDVVAPGSYILSAGARTAFRGECDPVDGTVPNAGGRISGLLSLQGTSMATPVVAAAAVLIRQYFEEGYYPSGTKTEGHGYEASGALVKAVLMSGAQYMVAVDNGEQGATPVTPYDNVQNFGRISLVDSLYLEGKDTVQAICFDRKKVNDGEMIEHYVSITFSESCPVGTPLRATLVWSDPPGVVGCKSCLLNDLDLFVTKNNFTSTRYYPNGLNGKDSKNNAERVEIADDLVSGDNFTVHVYGYNLATTFQRYSLVIAGCVGVPSEILVKPLDEEEPTPNPGINQQLAIVISLAVVGAIGLCCLCFAACSERSRRKGLP